MTDNCIFGVLVFSDNISLLKSSLLLMMKKETLNFHRYQLEGLLEESRAKMEQYGAGE